MRDIRAMLAHMNMMFDACGYTDDGRVSVEYCPNADALVITVCDKVELVKCAGYTNYGVMMKAIRTVERMYD